MTAEKRITLCLFQARARTVSGSGTVPSLKSRLTRRTASPCRQQSLTHTHTHTHTRARARAQTHTGTGTRTDTHTHTHALTHSHTHS